MRFQEMTKEQLYSELQKLQRRIADLELSEFSARRAEEALRESTKCDGEEIQRQALIFECISEGIVLTDIQGKVININPAAEKMFGYSKEELAGRFPDFLGKGKDSPGIIEDAIQVMLKSGRWSGEINYLHKDGRKGICSTVVVPLMDECGRPVTVIAVNHDVTGRRMIERALRESEERFRNAFEHAAVGMALVATNGRFLQINRYFCDIVGYSEKELIRMTNMDITHPEDLHKSFDYIRDLRAGKIQSYQLENRYLHKLGHTVWVLITVSLVRDNEGRPLHYIGQAQNITQRKRMEEDLLKAVEEAEMAREKAEKLARTDYLTGLLNRRAFMDLLLAESCRTKREGTPLSLIITDIDHFKEINDTYGHQAGDTCLQRFAACLARHCRQYDFIGRYGGEEFIICLPNTTCDQAERIAERIRAGIQDQPVTLPGNISINITASFGVSGLDDQDWKKDYDILITQADKALYMAKTRSRNIVCRLHS